jgi:hypothetical protein
MGERWYLQLWQVKISVPLFCSPMSAPADDSHSVPPAERSAAWKMEQPPREPSTRKRPKRPRIDIDEQIEEANRLAALLKKVQQSAKNIKKCGQRTKKRLIAKAGRLSGDDLERISVIKRCGLILDPKVGASNKDPSDERTLVQASKDTTRDSITAQLVRIFDGIMAAPPSSGASSSSTTTSPVIVPNGSADDIPNQKSLLRLASSAKLGCGIGSKHTLLMENGTQVLAEVGDEQMDRSDHEKEDEVDLFSFAAEPPDVCST